jgi:chromosome segregation ATPase
MSSIENSQVAVSQNVSNLEPENSDDDEEYYDNPVDVIKEFGSHPLMERAQRALTEQLKETQYRLQVNLLEKDEDLKRLTKDRETLGVQLYNLQQQLARIQISLENEHNRYNGIVDARIQEEDISKNVEKNNEDQLALLNEYKKQSKKYATELDSLNETIQQIEKYNDEVKSEIALTRRATYKAEQSMQQLEKHKEYQDVYVDNLNKQVKQLEEQIEAVKAQLASQSNETNDATNIIKETVRELELIATQKKQLIMQWKAALSGLSRRDEALAQASQTLANAESAVNDFDVEIETIRRDIIKEQGRNETLVNLRDRLEHELLWVEENLTKMRAEREQLQERYALLNKSLAQTEAEGKKIDGVTKQLEIDAESLLQSLQVVTQERQRMEEEIQLIYSSHSNISKAVQNLLREQGKVLKRIHERENEINEIENEIARTKVDRLNASALNYQLQEQLNVVLKELHDKESVIAKYQLEIRQRNDEIEKKMYRVDRLNKKYEKIVESAGGEENLGPLESTIRNLNKEIDSINNECKELERDWLKKQTEMVGLSSEADKVNEENGELRARVTILTQQQLRLERDQRNISTDIKTAKQTVAELQKDMTKLNALISANHNQENQLQNSNFILETECVEELKEMEKECITLQASINDIKTSNATLSDEIMEVERQALLWEKKIQLDKETREALDPTVGQQEAQNMEHEIHRMSLRLETLRREQERLAIEMERAVNKRATISSRYRAVPTGGTIAKQELTQASIKKKIANLKRDSRALAEENSQCSSKIEEKKAHLHELTSELERVTAQYSMTEEISHNLQGEINDLLYKKQLNQERIAYRQKYLRRLRELSQEGVELTQSLQVERRLLSSNQALDNVREIIGDLQQSYPHLADVLERVKAMADPDLSIVRNDQLQNFE